jgi:hypothetical protein
MSDPTTAQIAHNLGFILSDRGDIVGAYKDVRVTASITISEITSVPCTSVEHLKRQRIKQRL